MRNGNIAEAITVVGSGASIVAGLATSLTSVTQVLGLSLPAATIPAVGLGAFLIGGVVSLLIKDRIIKKAEEDTKALGFNSP